VSAKPEDGGAAFPVPMFTRQADGQPMCASDFFEGGNGMSLRDWFAGMALQGIISSIYFTPQVTFEECVGRAYGTADAMLAAREGKEESK